MHNPYTALTIGPIYDTMLLTSSPAGLWGASSLFSWIAKELLCELAAHGVSAAEIVSPYCVLQPAQKDSASLICTVALYDPADPQQSAEYQVCEEMHQIGVGLFHDRIVLKGDHMQAAEAATAAVIRTLAQNLASALGLEKQKLIIQNWLKNYLRIVPLCMDVPKNQGVLRYLGPYLSALELEPQFVTQETENYLLSLLENVRPQKQYPGRNDCLKNSFLVTPLGQSWMLYDPSDERRVKDISQVANPDGGSITSKYQNYYAVYKSDGDSMGALLQDLCTEEEIRSYSRQCLLFCARASKIIRDYGGMPLYAGGDDLLALLPAAHNGKTVFGLAEELRLCFNEVFRAEQRCYHGKPTLSAGISIQYQKSPLYEALERADSLLHQAKAGAKNALYVELQKHSGKSLLFAETQLDLWAGQCGQNLTAQTEAIAQSLLAATPIAQHQTDQRNFLASAGFQLEKYQPLFRQAFLREMPLQNLFDNLFDGSIHPAYQQYLEDLRLCLELIWKQDRPTDALAQWLRDFAQQITLLNESGAARNLSDTLRTLSKQYTSVADSLCYDIPEEISLEISAPLTAFFMPWHKAHHKFEQQCAENALHRMISLIRWLHFLQEKPGEEVNEA